MSAPLKPCPFCGGVPHFTCDDYINGRIVENPEYRIECDGAAAGTCPVGLEVVDRDPDRLCALWNTRANWPLTTEESAAPDLLAALEAAEIACAELCNDQDPANECWVTLATVRAAIAKARGQS